VTEHGQVAGVTSAAPARRRGYLRDGTPITLRPLLPSDVANAKSFFAGLSAQSRYFRFMRPVRELDQNIIRALLDQSREPDSVVLVAVHGTANGGEIVGGGRCVRTRRRSTGEFAITVIDSWQGRGLGTVILHALLREARVHGYHRMIGYVLAQNTKMLAVAARAGMRVRRMPTDPGVCMVSRMLFWVPRAGASRPPPQSLRLASQRVTRGSLPTTTRGHPWRSPDRIAQRRGLLLAASSAGRAGAPLG
jgi:acetyltransferase